MISDRLTLMLRVNGFCMVLIVLYMYLGNYSQVCAMGKFFDFRLFLLMVIFGVGYGLYNSSVPLLFQFLDLKPGTVWVWSYFSNFVSLCFMSLILFVMWWVGRGVNLRRELVSTCVSLFLGAWLGWYVGEGFGHVVFWLGSIDIFFFLRNIFLSASYGSGLFFKGFTGVTIRYLTGGEFEEAVE